MRTLSILLRSGLLLNLASLPACANATAMPGLAEFGITYWWGPPPSETNPARYDEIKSAGFNLVSLPSPDVRDEFHPYFDKALNTRILDLCAARGMKALVADQRMAEALGADGHAVDEILDGIVADYKDHPALYGYYVVDEPTTERYPRLARIVARLREKDPAHVAYVNLFPIYAPAEFLKAKDYQEYVERFVTEVKPAFISYDNYHFVLPNVLVKRPESFASDQEQAVWETAHAAAQGDDRPGFFDNLEIVRAVAMKHDLPFMVIVLLTTHGLYRDLTEPELRWEAFQTLAYGSSCLSWFTYWAPPDDDAWHFRNAVFNWDGQMTDHYGEVTRVNADVRVLGNKLMGKGSEAVYCVGSERNQLVRRFVPHGPVRAIEGPRLTAGFFEGGYLLLAHKNYREAGEVTLYLTDGAKAWLIDKPTGTERPLTVHDGKVTLTLAPGDGDLLRLE